MANDVDSYVSGRLIFHWTFWIGKLGFGMAIAVFFLIYFFAVRPFVVFHNKVWENFVIAVIITAGIAAGYFINEKMNAIGKQLLKKEYENI
jgi:hypothetical protein